MRAEYIAQASPIPASASTVPSAGQPDVHLGGVDLRPLQEARSRCPACGAPHSPTRIEGTARISSGSVIVERRLADVLRIGQAPRYVPPNVRKITRNM